MANRALERYGQFVARKPLLILGAALIFVIISIIASSQLKTEASGYEEMMPKNIPEIDAMNFIQDEFGTSGESVTIMIEVNPNYAKSDEPRDIRDPAVFRYCDILQQKIARVKNVLGVSSAADLLKRMNSGHLPGSRAEILELTRSSDQFDQYITGDYSTAVIRIQLAEMPTDEQTEFVTEITQIVAETEGPAGIKVSTTGSPFIMIELEKQIGPTLATTSTISFTGILVIVFVLFMSVRHGITSLLGLLVGVITAYGLFAILGMEMSSITSGGISMIMGVGIDFGIQVVTRFRYELRTSNAEVAIETTLANTIKPMLMTVLAALIGFSALSIGKITALGALGRMMSIGVTMCFFGAITVIPSILILNEKYFKVKDSKSQPAA